MADLQRKGFKLVSVTEPDLCSEEPVRKLMRQMLGAFSEYEKAMIVSKLAGARQRVKAKEGRCEGRKPYGWFSGEKTVLERMKKLREQGMAYDKIADALNREGRKPRTGTRKGSECKWHPGVVYRILNGA